MSISDLISPGVTCPLSSTCLPLPSSAPLANDHSEPLREEANGVTLPMSENIEKLECGLEAGARRNPSPGRPWIIFGRPSTTKRSADSDGTLPVRRWTMIPDSRRSTQRPLPTSTTASCTGSPYRVCALAARLNASCGLGSLGLRND
jgi:hypothetical protein